MTVHGEELPRRGDPADSERRWHWPGAASTPPSASGPADYAALEAVFADVLAKEKISTWIREPFVEEGDDHKPLHPEGTGIRAAIGELMTCTRCVGTWSALGLVALRTASPAAGRATVRVLALAGTNDLMQSGFRLLAERTNCAIADAERHSADDGGSGGR